MENITQINVSKIKPDKNQPRKSFDREKVKQMAISMKTEGVINPIEIDKNHVIVTGELRWRAAKEAGLKTVPCKFIDIEGDKRFIRQVVENLHHNTMPPYDTARAFIKILEIERPELFGAKRKKGNEIGLTWLSKRIGISVAGVQNFLQLLQMSPAFEEAVKKGLSYSMAELIRKVPEKYKKRMEKKIINKEFQSRDIGRTVTSALKRCPDLADRIINVNYKGLNQQQAIYKLESLGVIYLSRELEKAHKAPKEISKLIIELNRWLKENPPEDMGKLFLKDTLFGLKSVENNIGKWSKGKLLRAAKAKLIK